MPEEKPCSIAFFTDSFLPQVNGVVTSIIILSRILADRGHRILIVAPRYDDIEEFEYPGIEIHRVPSIPARYYPNFRWTWPWSRTVRKLLVDKGMDVIHVETPSTIGIMGKNLAKKLRLPMVNTFHTFVIDPNYYKQFYKSTHRFFGMITNALVRWFYNASDLVTSPSTNTNKELANIGVRVPMKYISNGIELDKFDNSRSDEVRNRYDLKGKTVLFVGRVSYEKNIEVLIEAFYRVLDQEPDAKLLVVGDGPLRQQLQEEVHQRGHEEAILFTGSIPNEELVVSGIFGAVEVFATASVTENQPMTILEAQANGIVCVGPDVRGIPNLIFHEDNGLLVEPNSSESMAEAIIRLLKDGDFYRHCRERTWERVKEHEIHAIAGTWEKTYQELIEKKRKK
jgi:glycosyltransferase involved in cell wall biosynthesis